MKKLALLFILFTLFTGCDTSTNSTMSGNDTLKVIPKDTLTIIGKDTVRVLPNDTLKLTLKDTSKLGNDSVKVITKDTVKVIGKDTIKVLPKDTIEIPLDTFKFPQGYKSDVYFANVKDSMFFWTKDSAPSGWPTYKQCFRYWITGEIQYNQFNPIKLKILSKHGIREIRVNGKLTDTLYPQLNKLDTFSGVDYIKNPQYDSTLIVVTDSLGNKYEKLIKIWTSECVVYWEHNSFSNRREMRRQVAYKKSTSIVNGNVIEKILSIQSERIDVWL